MGQIGHYGPGDIRYIIAHDGTELLELNDVSLSTDVPMAPGGTGLGFLKNRYHTRTGPAAGTFSIARNQLTAAEKGTLFMKLITGAGIIITEAIASAATTHTPGQTLTSILAIHLADGTLLEETLDYTVNYATGIITFNAALSQAAEIQYASTDADWMGLNLMLNSSLADDITNIWSGIATGTVARSAAAKYVGSYGLLITIGAQNDGADYEPNIAVFPGRVYRLTAWLKGVSAADDIDARWQDSGGWTAMTAVGTANVLANGTWKLHEWTFTPDEATILDIAIRNVDAAASSNIYLDEIYLRENAPAVNMMNAGLNKPFEFDIWKRRVVDGVIMERARGCSVYTDAVASGEAYTETIDGQFLDRDVIEV